MAYGCFGAELKAIGDGIDTCIMWARGGAGTWMDACDSRPSDFESENHHEVGVLGVYRGHQRVLHAPITQGGTYLGTYRPGSARLEFFPLKFGSDMHPTVLAST